MSGANQATAIRRFVEKARATGATPSEALASLDAPEAPVPCKRPVSGAWRRVYVTGSVELYDHALIPLRVLSSVDWVGETEGGNGWEYHVSVSRRTKTFRQRVASDDVVKMALEAFGMTEAREDNHVPNGVVRNFWLPVDGRPPHCDCETTEAPHPMGDGTTSAVWREDGKGRPPGPLEPASG